MTDGRHRVVIVGGGFGGLDAAKALRSEAIQVTLVDRRNFHLFQPFLYQVATGGLDPGDIAYPLREIFKRYPNFRILAGEMVDIDPDQRRVVLGDTELHYDTLILATGASHHYFGHGDWEEKAPGLKTVEDALEMRRRIFLAFEIAEGEAEREKQKPWITFVVVGGGPTGVELAGALGELVRDTLKGNFRNINFAEVRVFLIEALDRVLHSYPPSLSAKAEVALARLGVTVRLGSLVTQVGDGTLSLKRGDETEEIRARTVLWTAGVKASTLGEVLAKKTGAELDRAGRVKVSPDLTVRGRPDIFVIGDLANFSHQHGSPLPGLATVAKQQGRYVARVIKERLRRRIPGPFRYRDKGNLAVIGRNAAVANFGPLRLNGFLAWLIWILVHIRYLVGFDNKLRVLFQWAWNYLTHKRGARLIIGKEPNRPLRW